MLDIKKLLAKMLTNGVFNLKWETGVNNTTDTRVPVFRSGAVQHRVIPNDANVNATKTNSSKWTGGTITCFRKGNCCTVKFSGVAHPQITARTTIGTIPSGYRPPSEVEIIMCNVSSSGVVTNGSVVKFLVETNGEIKIDPTASGTVWATLTYCV